MTAGEYLRRGFGQPTMAEEIEAAIRLGKFRPHPRIIAKAVSALRKGKK